jgi:hypothetical protein
VDKEKPSGVILVVVEQLAFCGQKLLNRRIRLRRATLDYRERDYRNGNITDNRVKARTKRLSFPQNRRAPMPQYLVETPAVSLYCFCDCKLVA